MSETIPDEVTTEPTDEVDDEQTFSADYVKTLREEAATNRVKAREADERATTLLAALRDAAIRQHASGILADPSDLAWSDDMADEDGMPDSEAITAAAEALATDKPHLGRVRGDAGQGYRGDASGTVDLAGMLRAGA